MNKLWIVLVMTALVMCMSACETMKGLGKDVEDAGEWVQEKAS